jgi:hypothetical protein
MTDDQLRQFGLIDSGETPVQAREFLVTHREESIDLLYKTHLDGNVSARMDKEQEWYNATKTFMPPAELWSRHPGYEKFRRFQKGKTKLSKDANVAVSRATIYQSDLY